MMENIAGFLVVISMSIWILYEGWYWLFSKSGKGKFMKFPSEK